ncbi:Beta-lactamase-like protein [Penicillium expansum]|uniref:Beta-lactamase-like protein n=1 Tax=Penicillium expansum TaxID=27334 RepID=A0A0A2J849_PENEN|nr:Beta-lactamase-like protein [Penicillium expansum]KGO45795.1 Beta-lactamase-like protein [Penicillium expansum]KGO50951.1 Beta-lactamase-like protein [Penicillium expansum]KGO57935.1 Beta-lactamase-like protein [Penicillium expansum]
MKTYGVSDTIISQPVTEHTLFFAGSTTKAFTSAAISLLVDDNINFPAIHWNTPVHTILPTDFVLNDTWATSQMTIIDILSHRSGLPRHDWVWLANITLQEAVQSMRHLPFTASPRTEWQYSNLMYGVASHLIETVTNQSLQVFFTENIWLPMNMTETYVSLSEARAAQRDISQGYYVDLDGKIAATERIFTDTIRGAGNILSSVSDYAKWISTMLKRGPPFSQTGYDAFGGHFIVSPNPMEPFQTPTLYGLGWMSHAYKGERILFHEGSQFGYGASVMLLPQRDFGLVLLGNNMDGVNAASNALAYHLIDEELEIPLDSRFDWVARGDAMINDGRLSDNILSELYPRIPDPPLASPINLSAYEGSYTHPAYPELRMSRNCTKGDSALNRTTPDLCASLVKYNDYSKDLEIKFFHVSGTYWVQIAVRWGVPSAARVEFLIGPDGLASWLGIEIDPLMANRGEKIWWRHVL